MDFATLHPETPLRKHEAAEYLGVAKSTVEKWMKERRLVPIKMGKSVRFTPKILDEFKETCRSTPMAV